jgi:hypothetical protein
MIFLGKLTEPDKEKHKKVWDFLSEHIGSHGCDLRIVGDEHNADNDVIKHDEKYQWFTDFEQVGGD